MVETREVYAKIENGNIVDYPVYPTHIKNRSHPINWYTPCIFETRPVIKKYQYLKEKLKVSPDRKFVYITYEVDNLPLESLFQRIPPRIIETEGEENSPFMDMFGIVGSSNLIEDPPSPELINEIKNRIIERVDNELNEFARSRDYTSIVSAVSYINSSNPKFKAEGQYCSDLRDAVWPALFGYLQEILSNTVPVPISYAEIQERIPQFKWPDEH
jgi:hypothetical protein